jgi:hypothetical protein
MVASCGPGDLCSIPARDRDSFSSPPLRPDRLWGSLSLRSSGYRGLFTRGKAAEDVKLTTQLHLAPQLRMLGAIPPLPNLFSWCGAWLNTAICLFTFTNTDMYADQELNPTSVEYEANNTTKTARLKHALPPPPWPHSGTHGTSSWGLRIRARLHTKDYSKGQTKDADDAHKIQRKDHNKTIDSTKGCRSYSPSRKHSPRTVAGGKEVSKTRRNEQRGNRGRREMKEMNKQWKTNMKRPQATWTC